MRSAAICAYECREICTDILWTQAAAIDASFVISVLEQLPNNHLMFLVFSHAAIHFVKMHKSLSKQRKYSGTTTPSEVIIC
jgi:trans-aconitate methyltransferase